MDKQEIIDELRNIIAHYLEGQGFSLVDIIYRYEGKDLFVRILADRPESGISLGECAFLNKDIGRILEGKDILKERYILEISSPGLDRSLKTKMDFLRCMNKKVRIFLNEPIQDKQEWEGQILQAGDDAVFIDVKGEELQIPFVKIIQARQVVK